jgi:MFS family permease
MLATLRQRDFSLLWVAGLVSLTGNWMLSIALPVVVYTMTGSVLAVGGMLLATTLPSLLFASIAGVFVDRWDRRRTIVIANLLLAVSILPLFLVRSAEWLWLVYVVSFAQSTLTQFFVPAENTMLPLLSASKLLVSANALNALNNNLARLIGPALGGLIAVRFGLDGVIIIDVITYVIAAVLTMLIRVSSHPGKSDTAAKSLSPGRFASEWLEGVRVIWREKTLRTLFTVSALTGIGESVLAVLFVPFVTEVLRSDALHVGGLMSAQAVGGIMGGVVITWIAPRVRTYRLLGVSAVMLGLVDLVLFNYSTFFTSIAFAYGLLVVAGPWAVGIGAGYNTLIQSNAADAYRGRVFATLGLTTSLFTLVGIVLAGFAGDTFGIVPVINIQGYVYILAGIICLVVLREKYSRKIGVSSTP